MGALPARAGPRPLRVTLSAAPPRCGWPGAGAAPRREAARRPIPGRLAREPGSGSGRIVNRVEQLRVGLRVGLGS